MIPVLAEVVWPAQVWAGHFFSQVPCRLSSVIHGMAEKSIKAQYWHNLPQQQ